MATMVMLRPEKNTAKCAVTPWGYDVTHAAEDNAHRASSGQCRGTKAGYTQKSRDLCFARKRTDKYTCIHRQIQIHSHTLSHKHKNTDANTYLESLHGRSCDRPEARAKQRCETINENRFHHACTTLLARNGGGGGDRVGSRQGTWDGCALVATANRVMERAERGGRGQRKGTNDSLRKATLGERRVRKVRVYVPTSVH